MPRDNEHISESLDYQESDEREQNQQLGAKILSGVHFESSHQPIVGSSFNKAIKKGEKLPGKNNERRNLSYLNRLNKLIEKHGNRAEQKLWQASIKDDLLVKYVNIPESYWNAKRQELRDNALGGLELTEEYKHAIYNKERGLQQESLEKWVNYLGDEHSPYPLWFKVYAWDGMTKMGRYNKRKGKYEIRNETTVAPYPNPDAEVLAGVFDVINRYYGNNEKEFYTKEGERNIKLEQIVQSGNFPKIFNAIQQDIAPIIEPPEKAKDVHGEWVEYKLGDEDDIARAARGTGWCVVSPSVGRHYLKCGTYGNDYDERNETDVRTWKNYSKFILFHLIDEKTGKLSKSACASIRLAPNGTVAEISGLRDGQALDDSLVPTVEEKVKSLPGGERFLEAFADKNMLIALDHKMQKGEDLTKEELEFIYELKRPIRTLDTYNIYDPRVSWLKRKYDIRYALDAGADTNSLLRGMKPYDIVINLDTLISHGANLNQLASKLDSRDVARNLDTLTSHGANIDQLVSKLDLRDVARNLDALISHGAKIDIDQLVSKLDLRDVARNLDALISHGAKIDIDQLVSELGSYCIVENLDTLTSHGANIDQLVSEMESFYIAQYLDILISHGANIDRLVSNMDSDYCIDVGLDTLISRHGANIDLLVSKMKPYQIVTYLDILIGYGAKIDIDQLVSELDLRHIVKNLDTLISHGVNINLLASKVGPDILRQYGVNI